MLLALSNLDLPMNSTQYRTQTDRAKYWFQFTLLFLVTVFAQLSNIAYEKAATGQSFISTLVPSLIFLSLLTIPTLAIGLKLGPKLGLGLVNKRLPENNTLSKGIRFAVVMSIILGATLLAVRWGVSSALPREIPEYGFRGALGGLLVSFGAGIGEEIWFRFGLMTLLLFLCSKFKGTPLNNNVATLVILFVGVCFGLAHLPQLISFNVNDAFSIWATIIGNICVASLYGWCYWRYGLISAIVAHVNLDIVLHSLPAFF